MGLDQIQLNQHLCNYLRKRLKKTRNVLEDIDRTLIHRARNNFQLRASITEVDLVVRRAKDLESKCMCKQSSWLDAAITLIDIKEEVLEIVLDLWFWTSMLKIAVADSDMEESEVIRSTTKVVKKHEDLLQKLSEENSSLQKAASDDRDHLLAELEQVTEKHASSRSGSTVVLQQNPEYVLALYLLSRIKEDDQFARDRKSKQLKVPPGISLGSGASGDVSEVTWLQQKCALKVLKVADEKEATILRGCNHPHIVRFLWYWEHQKRSHIMMEWMPTDLCTHIEGLLEKNGGTPFQLHVAIDIMLQIAKAMRYLHTKKIVHRDLKPKNILVQPDIDSEGYVQVKLADFGISKFYNMSETPSLQTSEKGTSAYAAPEVFKQKPEHADNTLKFPPKADVWSFAMVCSEILTGEVPFHDKPKVTLHDDIKRLGIRPNLPSNCPRDLHLCITSCWDLNPKKRPTFVEVCKMLKLVKAASLGVTRLDVHKLFLPQDYNTVAANPKNSLHLNTSLTSDKSATSQPWNSLLPKKFLRFGGTKKKNLVGEIHFGGIATTRLPPLFSYKVLKKATNNFDNNHIVGRGGFATVYKGVLPNGEKIAVKYLYESKTSHFDNEKFQNEVVTMTGITHKNIVQIKGYCIHAKKKLIVQEFVQNNSLAETLFDGKGNHDMDWPTRQKICLGIASGLQYIHEDSQPPLIHRDIKPSNILLDKYFHAKITDFGLARICQEDRTFTTQIAGTMGYLAPEYITFGDISVKCDVFSFGILLLEIVSGRKNIDHSKEPSRLIDLAYNLNEDEKLLELVDSRLDMEDHQMILNVIRVGLLCVQGDYSLRPYMAQVVAMLKGELELDDWKNVKLFKNIDWNQNMSGSWEVDLSYTFTTIVQNSSYLKNRMHDLTTTSFEANQSREFAKPIVDTRKGKEPMEEDEMSNHAFTTHSKNIIKGTWKGKEPMEVHYEVGSSSAPPPRQPFAKHISCDLTWHQELEAQISTFEGKLNALCCELKQIHKLLIDGWDMR